MANFPLKLLVSFVQKRSIRTKASTLVKPISDPAKKSDIQPKTKDIKPTTLLPAAGERGQSVIALLKHQHFSETQIAKLVDRCPRILNAKVATNLKPKFKFLNKNGFKGTLLPEIIISNPIILRRSLNAHLIPALEFLKTQLGKDNEIGLHMVIKRASWILTADYEKVLQPNMMTMEKEGMSMRSILKLFTTNPRIFLQKISKVQAGLKTVENFGIKPHEPMYVHALRVVLSINESNLKKKLEFFKSLGWSDAEMTSSIVRQPLCLTCSEEKVKRIVDFLVKTMKVEPEVIIANPKLVMYSLKRRIIPRCTVLKLLQEKKLVKKRMITSILTINERDFLEKYIVKYVEFVPCLWDIYHGDSRSDAVAVKE